jgi:hypothetical protein
MKKLSLDDFDVESFVTTRDPEAPLGTVQGHEAAGFTDGASCYFSDCATCAFTCGPTNDYSCPASCRFTCTET